MALHLFLIRKDSGEFSSLLRQFTRFESSDLGEKPKFSAQKRFMHMRFLNRDLFAKLAILRDFLEISDIWMEYQVFGPLVEITQEIPPFCAGGGRHGR